MVLEQNWQNRNKKYRMNRKINSIPVVRTKTGEQDRRTIMENTLWEIEHTFVNNIEKGSKL